MPQGLAPGVRVGFSTNGAEKSAVGGQVLTIVLIGSRRFCDWDSMGGESVYIEDTHTRLWRRGRDRDSGAMMFKINWIRDFVVF